MQAWSHKIRIALLMASGSVVFILLSLAYVQKQSVHGNLLEVSDIPLPASYWLFIGTAFLFALLGIVIWKYGFPPYDYRMIGTWWGSLLVGLIALSLPTFVRSKGGLFDMIAHNGATGVGVYMLAQGLVEVTDKVRTIGK